MRAIALSIAVLLCALISSADPFQRKTFAAATPCVPNVVVLVTDDSSVGACAGGGVAESACVCSDDGTTIASFSGGHDAQTDAEARWSVINVMDPPYSAACDFLTDATDPGTVTDDHDAIQDAIDAAFASATTKTVYFPRLCYTASALTWEFGVDLVGAGNRSSGIACAAAIAGDCITTDANGGLYHRGLMERMRVSRTGVCTPQTTKVCVGAGSGCSNCGLVAGVGSGIVVDDEITQEGNFLQDIWVTAFPDWGIKLDKGTTPLWAANIGLFSNGFTPAVTGTADTPFTTTTLHQTGAGWATTGGSASWCGSCSGTGEHIGKWVRITGGTGQGQVRVILSHTADTLTVGSWTSAGGTTPDATSTFAIDAGGGMLVRAGGTGSMTGCSITNVSGDENEGGLIVFASGSQHSNADNCVVTNLKIEVGASATAPQKCGVRIASGSPYIVFNGITVTGTGATTGAAAICAEAAGSVSAGAFEWHGVSIQEANIDYTINTEWSDTPSAQIQILRADSGFLPDGINSPRTTAEPFACAPAFEGNRWFDTNLGNGEWCYCDGTNWVESSDPTTTCT